MMSGARCFMGFIPAGGVGGLNLVPIEIENRKFFQGVTGLHKSPGI